MRTNPHRYNRKRPNVRTDALGIVSRENKPGEIWLYIPRGARRISIMHDKFGVLRNYFYPDIIEKATVYEMEIQIGDGAQQTPANTNTQLIVMRPDPATADIYIDDEKYRPKTDCSPLP